MYLEYQLWLLLVLMLRIIQILWLMLVLIWHVVLLVKPKLIWGMISERKYDTFGDDALKRFDAGLGVGVALELGKVIVGLDGQFGLVDVEK